MDDFILKANENANSSVKTKLTFRILLLALPVWSLKILAEIRINVQQLLGLMQLRSFAGTTC